MLPYYWAKEIYQNGPLKIFSFLQHEKRFQVTFRVEELWYGYRVVFRRFWQLQVYPLANARPFSLLFGCYEFFIPLPLLRSCQT